MISPVILRIGTIEIRWYGLIMALAFLIGIYMSIFLGKKRNLKKEDILDFSLYLIPSSVIMARLFHVFVYNFNYYINDPIKILKIWEGGVSLYGGLTGALIAALYFSHIKKIKFFDIADVFIIPLSFGIIFGRIGNFINQELYGKITTLPWGVVFDSVPGKRHPTQIYEAFGHLLIFITLLILWKRGYKDGKIFLSFIIIYSVFRFFMEFLREGNPIFLNLTTTQIIVIPILLISSILITKKPKTIDL